MEKITTEIYQQHPERYSLVSGDVEGAPTCPYGNIKQWVGYDVSAERFIRFSKSLYKKLVTKKKLKK